MTTRVTQAVQHALANAPCSLRALADAAGVHHTTLVRIRGGTREASLELALRVADALDRWGDACHASAKGIRRVTPKRRGQS